VKKFIVVSYEPEQQSWYYDVVFAESEDAAKQRILRLRDYCIDADVFDMRVLQRMTNNVREETLLESEKWMAELADERDADADADARETAKKRA